MKDQPIDQNLRQDAPNDMFSDNVLFEGQTLAQSHGFVSPETSVSAQA
jgi:hypothetical protein